MKVRIGISLGPAGSPDQFAGAVDSLEQAGADSLWLPKTVYSPVVEPFTGMALAGPHPPAEGGQRDLRPAWPAPVLEPSSRRRWPG